VSFNYLGHFDDGGETGLFQFADESPGTQIGGSLRRQHALDVSGMVVRGRLQLTIIFDPQVHRREMITNLLNNWQLQLSQIAAHCRARQHSEKTASDFTYAELSMDDLEHIRKLYENSGN